jgi:hypothetical protein
MSRAQRRFVVRNDDEERPQTVEKSLEDYAREAALHAMGSKGFACPNCGCKHFETTNVYHVRAGLRRRRVCRNCGRVASSTEIIDPPRENS